MHECMYLCAYSYNILRIHYSACMYLCKPLAVLNMSVLGFVREDTKQFVPRPFAVAFVHLLHRHFHLATVSTCVGLTLQSKMFGAYPLVFCAEDDMVEVGESCGVLCGSDGNGGGGGRGGSGGDDDCDGSLRM